MEFLGRLTDEQVRDLYRGATAVLLPGEEDFGIVPVEAQACGRPVVALARGGALETVVDGVTGLLVDDDDPAAVGGGARSGAGRASSMAPRFAMASRANAERFSRERFLTRLLAEVRSLVDAPPETARW